jgi:hypothetical protein
MLTGSSACAVGAEKKVMAAAANRPLPTIVRLGIATS